MMKWIKFFEAFNSLDLVEVCEDIRSIAYELEDDGYEISIKLLLDAKEWTVTRIDVEQYDKELMVPLAIILEIRKDGKSAFALSLAQRKMDQQIGAHDNSFFEPSQKTQVNEDIERFVELLETHLDYIPGRIYATFDYDIRIMLDS
jgi:hypothetical protein